MRYVGTLLEGEDTYYYLDSTLLVRPDPPGAEDYMNTVGLSPNSTIAVDGHPVVFSGTNAIYVDDAYATFQGTLVNGSDPDHRVETLLIHHSAPSPVGGVAPRKSQPGPHASRGSSGKNSSGKK